VKLFVKHFGRWLTVGTVLATLSAACEEAPVPVDAGPMTPVSGQAASRTMDCTARDGECAAGEDSDCRGAKACVTLGKCTTREGRCVVGSNTDCLESEHCKRFGQCSLRNDVCAITSDQDCKRSDLCTLGGQCRAKKGDRVWECVG